MRWVCMLAAAVLLGGAAGADDSSEKERRKIERLFEEAILLSEDGKRKEALVVYRRILEIDPDSHGALYNGGLTAFLLKEYETARELWSRLRGLDPGDWSVRAKLVQTCQALGKKEERDKEIAALYELRKTTENEDLEKREFYCRDQFEAGGKKVMVFEHYELVGDRAIRWWFGVHDKKGEKEYHLSLGSYDSTNQLMKDFYKLEEGERAYHLDGYFPWGHATYGFFRGEPDYDEIRKLVVGIVEGKVEPVSSSRTGRGPEKESEEPPKEDR